MYGFNLIIALLFYPVISYFVIGKLKKKTSGILLLLGAIIGSCFAYLTTVLSISFEKNVFDTLVLNILTFSVFGIISWVYYHIYQKKWLHITSLFLVSIAMFFLLNLAFVPAEFCGQDYPERTFYVDKNNHKITHSGYQYGYLDYGSRFIILKHSSGIERIIGMAENANYYYGKEFRLSEELEKGKIFIDYKDYKNTQRRDTLDIQMRE